MGLGKRLGTVHFLLQLHLCGGCPLVSSPGWNSCGGMTSNPGQDEGGLRRSRVGSFVCFMSSGMVLISRLEPSIIFWRHHPRPRKLSQRSAVVRSAELSLQRCIDQKWILKRGRTAQGSCFTQHSAVRLIQECCMWKSLHLGFSTLR